MIYLASPFFNEFEVMVRDRMYRKAQEVFGEPIFRPDLSASSSQYARAITGKERFETSKAIYKDNVSHIDSCDKLVFPADTTDLGTSFELGYAMINRKRIFRYDYLSDEITELTSEVISKVVVKAYQAYFKLSNGYKETPNIEISSPGDATVLGILNEESVSYSIKSGADNVMLAAEFPYFCDGKITDPSDRNWEGSTIL